MRKFYPLLLFVALIFSFAPRAVEAGSEGVSWSAVPYYGGFVSGPYVPVKVRISAGENGLSGVVRYVSRGGKGDNFVYEKPVSIEPGGASAFVLYIAPTMMPDGKITLEFVHDGKVEFRNIKLQLAVGADALSAAMDYSSTILGLPGASNGVWWVHLPLEDFPRSVQGLMPLRVLLAPARDMEKLDDEQKRVLLAWVGSGGVFVLAGDPSGFAHLPGELRVITNAGGVVSKELPAKAFGVESKTKPPAVRHYLFTPSAEASVLARGNDGAPWAVGKAVGWGRVVYLAFDPDNPPLSGWSGAPDFWNALSRKLSGGRLAPLPGRSFRTAILSQISGGALPSLTLLFLIFFVYLLVVGPLNYVVLKKLTKLEYAWVTIPAITLVFTGGVYLAGNAQRSKEVHVSRYGVIRMLPGWDYGLADGGMAVYSTLPMSVSLDLPSSFLIHPFTIHSSGVGGKGTGGISMRLREGKRPSVALSSNEGWKLATFGLEGIVAGPEVEFSSVEMGEGPPRWSIKNGTGKKLETPMLLIGKHAFLYRDVSPGGTSMEGEPLRSVWVEDSLEDVFMPRSLRPPSRKDARESLFNFAKTDMVSDLLLGFPMGKFQAYTPVPPGMSHGAFAAAWVKESAPDIFGRSGGIRIEHHAITAFVAPVELKYKGRPARVLLNENFHISNNVRHPQEVCGPPGVERYFFEKGSWGAQWEYVLDSGDGWRPFRITWHVIGADVIPPPGFSADGAHNLRGSLRFYVYNFEKGKMEQMQVTEDGTVEISDPNPYWKDGTMKVALQGTANWPGGCAGADVEVLEVAP